MFSTLPQGWISLLYPLTNKHLQQVFPHEKCTQHPLICRPIAVKAMQGKHAQLVRCISHNKWKSQSHACDIIECTHLVMLTIIVLRDKYMIHLLIVYRFISSLFKTTILLWKGESIEVFFWRESHYDYWHIKALLSGGQTMAVIVLRSLGMRRCYATVQRNCLYPIGWRLPIHQYSALWKWADSLLHFV